MSLNIESNFSIIDYLEEEFSIERLQALVGRRVKSADIKSPIYGEIVGISKKQDRNLLIRWDGTETAVEVQWFSKFTFMETL